MMNSDEAMDTTPPPLTSEHDIMLQVIAPGGPEHLVVVAQHPPIPRHDEVVVRTQAAALNYRDLGLLLGKSAGSAVPPYTPLSDACGVVHAVGPDVRTLQIGERVCSSFFPDWMAGAPTPSILTALGASRSGVGARYFTLRETALVSAPAHLTALEAATLPCAGVTAWQGLFAHTHLQTGDSVLLQGTGGVSLFALQFAHAAGLRVIITSSSDDKLARAKELGASDLINYRRTPDWAEEVLRLTNGVGVDLVMEVGGADTLSQSLRAIRLDGTISVIGMLGATQAPLDIRAIYARNAHIHGITVGPKTAFQEMVRLVEAHAIRPVIGSVYHVREARAAFEAMAQGNIFGKIVLDFGA